jgi:hypothetical protein
MFFFFFFHSSPPNTYSTATGLSQVNNFYRPLADPFKTTNHSTRSKRHSISISVARVRVRVLVLHLHTRNTLNNTDPSKLPSSRNTTTNNSNNSSSYPLSLQLPR